MTIRDESQAGAGDEPKKAEASSTQARTVRSLVALAICAGVMVWAYGNLWDYQHPLAAAARGISHGSVESRLAAIDQVKELGLDKSKESIPPLVAALNDSESKVQIGAAQALGLIVSYAVRVQAETETVRDATAALAAALKNSPVAVRVEAARALAVIASTVPSGGRRGGGKKAGAVAKTSKEAGIDVPALAASYTGLLGEKDEDLRIAAAEGLGALGPTLDAPPSETLIAALGDSSPRVRIAATNSLLRYNKGLDPIVAKLAHMMAKDDSVEVRKSAASTIGHLPTAKLTAQSVPAFLDALKIADAETTDAIITLLDHLNQECRVAATPAFLHALEAPPESDRPIGPGSMKPNVFTGPGEISAQALARTLPGTPRAAEAVSALSQVLARDNPRRWPGAADAIASFGAAGAPAVPALISVLKQAAGKQEIANAALAAAKALVAVAPTGSSRAEAIAALKSATNSIDDSVRKAAAEALKKLEPTSTGSAQPVTKPAEKPRATAG